VTGGVFAGGYSRKLEMSSTKAALAAVGVAAVLLSASATLLAATPSAPSRTASTAVKLKGEQQLTRWRRVATWAHILHTAGVHAWPTTKSRVVTRLHYRTEDGFPEVYLVLSKLVKRNGNVWLKIALPMRPNGTTGWVPRQALGKLRRVWTWLVIDRSKLHARFYTGNRALWRAPVGIGKPSTPTPKGLFWVREQFVLPDQPFFGPYAFGTSAYANISEWPGGGVVGLHGTSEPQLIPGRPSHGCVRLRNRDIVWLAYHMPVGTPIAVVN
jgi:lipoprotein-anchoring transpeptidase ErfK/SrfK